MSRQFLLSSLTAGMRTESASGPWAVQKLHWWVHTDAGDRRHLRVQVQVRALILLLFEVGQI